MSLRLDRLYKEWETAEVEGRPAEEIFQKVEALMRCVFDREETEGE